MASSSSAASSVAAVPSKICFNPICKEPRPEGPRRRGWRLRSGEHAELCDRCCCAYEHGTFCETFHSDMAGWRKCESCGKRVHCGCIVSVSTFVYLDAGGVECIVCARKALSAAPNQMCQPLLFSSQVSERPRDHPVRSLSQMANSYSGQWRQGTHLWNTGVQSDLQQRLSYEFDRPIHSEKLIAVRSSLSGQEKKVGELPERQAPSSLIHVARNVTAGVEPSLAFNMYHREQGREQGSADGLHYSGHLGDNGSISGKKGFVSDPCSTSSSGVNLESRTNSCAKPLSSSISKGDSTSLLGLAVSFSPPNGSNDRVSMTQSRQMPPPLPKQFYPNLHNMNDSSAEMQIGRSPMDTRTRAQLLPRYWPKITDQELHKISEDSNSVITPLFEKILSASDAGRIGRLVLPKKCAEAYFPAISQPEGLPLKIHDGGGKEWVFQFRFWPNNNSRMYVLEGVTPCIQSMQLQAGDTVTFSRLDPEGKLVMGFRKAINSPSEQEAQTINSGNGPAPAEGSKSAAELNANGPSQSQKASKETRNPANAEDEATRSKFDKTGFIQKGGSGTKSSQGPSKRKGSSLGSRNKRLRIENEDSIQLNLTWEEAQGLLRAPHNDIPSIVVIEGHEIEEYVEAPVLGMPTIFIMNQARNNIQWVQCEDCSKWRMLPVDALLPFRWTCSENKWDPERSSCSSPQETSKELADVLPAKTSSRRTRTKVEDKDCSDVLGGLDALANFAILGEGETLPASSQPTTRHPRHRPGCTCIVCIQPPSGKGPKHKPSCTCNFCLTVKRRFRTREMRREKKKSEKDAAETAAAAIKNQSPPEMPSVGSDPLLPVVKSVSFFTSPRSLAVCHDGSVEDDSEKRVALPSPLKTKIDLNIQPEREEEQSPVAHAINLMAMFRDAAVREYENDSMEL